MATVSNNTQGNPYHDENTGEFTSSDKSSSGKSDGIKIKLKQNIGVNKPSFKLKTNIDPELIENIRSMNQVSSIPQLRSSVDVENNADKFFSKKICSTIDKMYGANYDCASYQFHPKSAPSVSLDLFPCVFGKYRYKDNHAHLLEPNDFEKLIPFSKFVSLTNHYNSFSWYDPATSKLEELQPIFRGFSSIGQKREEIIDSYCKADYNNFDFYGGGYFGSNIYTTAVKSYADGYARGTLVRGVVDTRNSYHLTEGEIYNIYSNINYDNVRTKVKNKLMENGLSDDKSNRISNSFINSLKNDLGLKAILLGCDFMVNDYHQRNILNLSRWYIRDDWGILARRRMYGNK